MHQPTPTEIANALFVKGEWELKCSGDFSHAQGLKNLNTLGMSPDAVAMYGAALRLTSAVVLAEKFSKPARLPPIEYDFDLLVFRANSRNPVTRTLIQLFLESAEFRDNVYSTYLKMLEYTERSTHESVPIVQGAA